MDEFPRALHQCNANVKMAGKWFYHGCHAPEILTRNFYDLTPWISTPKSPPYSKTPPTMG